MSEPIMACATPRGVASALALLRLSGEDLATRLQDFWGRPRAWCPGRVYRDRLPLPGGLIEDCLWTFFQAPRSYTGEDVVEISCHGNPLLVEQIEQALRERGFRQALPGEFTLRAVQRGRMGLVEAEGLLNYLEARSLPALVAAGKTLGGSLDHRYRMIGEMIGGMRALVEGSLEFSDTDGCASTPELLPLWEDLRREMDVLGQVARTSQQMARGLQVVLVGRPNVGKSSLFNRLLGVDRALVSELAGTTRDALREEWRSEGITLALWDVAGALETDEALDRMGVEKARETALAADLVLWVVDPEYPGAHQTVPAEWLRQDVPLLGVINRVDERSREAVSLWDERMRGWGHDVVRVSARTGEGVNLLRERLVSHAHRLWGTVEQTGMLGAYQREVVARARAHLWRAEELWQTGDWVLLAETLRWVDREWSALVGNRHPEDLMNRFFASFCVGK